MEILILIILKLHDFISLLDSSNKFFFSCDIWPTAIVEPFMRKKDQDRQEDSQEEGQVWQRTSYLALGLLL